MSERIKLFYVINGIKKHGEIELWEYDEKVEYEDDVKIKLYINSDTITKYSDNFFEALIEIRKELESLGINLLCRGCCTKVYPSAMLLSMGSGRKAYKLTIGEPATNNMLVDIFESCDEKDYGTIEEQKKFYKSWLDSIKSK
ncbi:hypothetical protein LJC58_08450 [Lachnospiraceae bacterium OttesenSCG-928-D06]|nr:hypothetical protein [Lachnospiraceae bacterium OttesenSCG-928-D06]